MLNLKPKHKP